MVRLYHALIRSLLVSIVLLPTWLAYVIPFFRMKKLGATISPEVWKKKHRRYARRFYWLSVKLRGGLYAASFAFRVLRLSP